MLDAILQPVLDVGDHSPEFQVAFAPPYMYQPNTQAFNDSTFATFGNYAANLVKYYNGVPSPVKHPEKLDIILFRENTEDVYSGVEVKEGTPEAEKLIDFLNNDLLKGGKKKIRTDSGVGIKPISITGSKRLIRAAIC